MRTNQGQNLSKLGLGLLLAVVISVISYSGVFDGLQGLGLEIGVKITSPFTRSFTAIDSGFGLITSLQQIRLENMDLTSQNAKLQSQLAELKDKETELTELLKQSNIKLPKSQEYFLAEIIQFSESPNPGTFFVYIGLEDIRTGDFVVSGNFIIGEVTDVIERYAEVKLTSVVGATYPVEVGNTIGKFEGKGQKHAIISRVGSTAKVSEGDEIVLAETNGPEPLRFLLGIVSAVEGLESDATQTIIVEIPLDISNLTHVFIVPNHV